MDLLLMAQSAVDSVVRFLLVKVSLAKEVLALLNNVLLPNSKLVKPMPVLLPCVLNKTSKPLSKLDVTRMPVL